MARNSRAQATVAPTDTRPQLDKKELLRLYTLLLHCRRLDERCRIMFRQGKFAGNFYSGVGQEAIEVGFLSQLKKGDWLAPSHRDFVGNLVLGMPLKMMMAQLFVRATSPDRGRQAPAFCGHPDYGVISPAATIGAQTNLGTGIALAFKMQKKPHVVVATFGDGATSSAAVHESLNFGAVHKLPIVYVCQNNLWAESVPLRLQTAIVDMVERGRGYGLESVSVDGNDLPKVYEVAREAIDRARRGGGPSFVECKTYRWYGHSEIDPAKYRDPKEVEEWKKREPIPRFEEFLAERKLFREDLKKEILAKFDKEMDEAVAYAEQSPYPAPDEALEHIYG